MKLAVFIERDGVLNKARVERNHQYLPLTAAEYQVNRELMRPLQQLREAGFLILATSNQPGLSRGYLYRSELDLMHRTLRNTLPVDDIMVCPHDEFDECPCRKPKPGLFVEAAFKWHLDLDHCFVISDKWHDAEAARYTGCTSLLINSPWIGPVHHDFVVPNFSVAVEKILSLEYHLDHAFATDQAWMVQ